MPLEEKQMMDSLGYQILQLECEVCILYRVTLFCFVFNKSKYPSFTSINKIHENYNYTYWENLRVIC